jgi:RNA polymerase sigma factor FliA
MATVLQLPTELTHDEMVMQNLPLVHFVARQLARHLSGHLEMDDLVDAGTIGLINAVTNYDASRGLAFSTFAAPRIRGAILDELRRWDHVPRTLRKRQRDLARAETYAEAKFGRTATDVEVANILGEDVQTVWKWRAESNELIHMSLDRPLAGGEDTEITPGDIIAGSTGTEIDDAMTKEEEVEYLKEELARLSDRDQQVLTLYYFEGLKLHEIGEILDLTESRVSQIRTKALKSLRTNMQHLRSA